MKQKIVSTLLPAKNVKQFACYKEVEGNVLFDWKDMPDPPPSYKLNPDIIRNNFKQKDGEFNAKQTHVCSYSCYFSDAVDVKFTRCLFRDNLLIITGKIPSEVQEYGFCNEPPPTTV